jgi:cell wall-associated NlpC family hydrolase
VSPEDAVHRARACLGLGVRYGLGAGGRRRHYPKPHDEQGKCDCSGFIAFCLDVDRFMPENPWYRNFNGGWLETTAIQRDCATPFGLFDPVPMSHARPGDLLVWGDRIVEGARRQGHVGIVTVADSSGPASVIHCSAGNDRAHNDAVQETGPGIFLANSALCARYALFEYQDVFHPEVPGVTPGPSANL